MPSLSSPKPFKCSTLPFTSSPTYCPACRWSNHANPYFHNKTCTCNLASTSAANSSSNVDRAPCESTYELRPPGFYYVSDDEDDDEDEDCEPSEWESSDRDSRDEDIEDEEDTEDGENEGEGNNTAVAAAEVDTTGLSEPINTIHNRMPPTIFSSKNIDNREVNEANTAPSHDFPSENSPHTALRPNGYSNTHRPSPPSVPYQPPSPASWTTEAKIRGLGVGIVQVVGGLTLGLAATVGTGLVTAVGTCLPCGECGGDGEGKAKEE